MSKNSRNWVLAFAASQIGFWVAGGLLLGLWVDRYFGTMPLFGLLGLVAGFGGGVKVLIQLVRAQKEKSPD